MAHYARVDKENMCSKLVSFAKIFEDLFGRFDQRMKRFQNILEDTKEESDDEEVNDTNDENQYEVLYNNNFHTTTYSNLYADINFLTLSVSQVSGTFTVHFIIS
jgi:hypothetical protein